MLKKTIILSLLTIFLNSALYAARPDFASIKDVKEKKKTFFNFMSNYAKKANKDVLTVRKELLKISTIKTPSSAQKKFVSNQCDKYKVDCSQYKKGLDNLLLSVDEIPSSLLLAQSANESAWGTSRFARKGNNYFGQWCFTKGCGIVPAKRDKGKAHEVMAFKSPYESVRAYIYNLNTGHNYKQMRAIRRNLRKDKQQISGTALAKGLKNYSERGNAYIKEISDMIRQNKLFLYDRKSMA
jgi:Bax protein